MEQNYSGTDSSNWMGQMKDLLAQRTLADMLLPGTHDSGTYDLKKELAPDADAPIPRIWSLRADGSFGVEDFILGWAHCQEQDFFTQLCDGIRYLDLRICSVDGVYRTCHSLLGNPIKTLLADIKRFLDQHTGELVFIKVGPKGGVSEDEANKYLTDQLGSLAISAREAWAQTYSQLINNGTRVVLDYGEYIEGQYAEADSTDAVVKYLQANERGWSTPLDKKLLETQFQLTAKTRMFVESFIQVNGCRLLPAIGALVACPILGPTLAVIGITSVVSCVLYLKNCSPVPRSDSDLADGSRTVIKQFADWYFPQVVGKQVKRTTNLMIADFYQRVPLVQLAICVNQNWGDPGLAAAVKQLTDPIVDTNDLPAGGVITNFLDCRADAVAAALYLAKFVAGEVAGVLKEGFDKTAQETAQLLKGGGFPADQVALALNDVFKLPWKDIGDILQGVAYPAQQVAGALHSLGVGADDAVAYLGDTVGKDAIAGVLEAAGYPADAVEHAVEKLCSCIANVCSCVTDVCGCVTKSVCNLCGCVVKCIHLR